MYPINLINNL